MVLGDMQRRIAFEQHSSEVQTVDFRNDLYFGLPVLLDLMAR